MPSLMIQNDQALLTVNALIGVLAKEAAMYQSRRSDTRYPYGARVQVGRVVEKVGFQPTGEGWCLDVSYQGIGMICEQMVLPGKRIHISMPTKPNGQLVIPVHVLHCVPLFGAVHRLSGVFVFDEPPLPARG